MEAPIYHAGTGLPGSIGALGSPCHCVLLHSGISAHLDAGLPAYAHASRAHAGGPSLAYSVSYSTLGYTPIVTCGVHHMLSAGAHSTALIMCT